MAKDDLMLKIGSWSFLIGIIIALVIGLFEAYKLETSSSFLLGGGTGGAIAWVLAALGAIVGIIALFGKGTITKQEAPSFLIAGIGLVVMYGVFKGIELTPWIGSLLQGVSLCLSIFVAPAVGILAIKAIWDMGKEV
jgi:hypothetical protein